MAMDLSGQAVDNLLLSKITAEIGSVRKTMQDIVSFNNENMGTWLLMDGNSCSGTAYEAKFGSPNVPDAYTDGAFFRQAKDGRTKGSFESDQMQSHRHEQIEYIITNAAATGDDSIDWHSSIAHANDAGMHGNPIGNPMTDGTNGIPRAGIETRPKNIAVNFMIKVNH